MHIILEYFVKSVFCLKSKINIYSERVEIIIEIKLFVISPRAALCC